MHAWQQKNLPYWDEVRAKAKERDSWGICSLCGSEHCTSVAYHKESAMQCIDLTQVMLLNERRRLKSKQKAEYKKQLMKKYSRA